MTEARRWLRNPWLVLAAEVALGVTFILSALPKIADPPAFAHMIYNYRMLPGALVNAMALFMPWLELFAGAALVLGVWRRPAGVAVALLLLVFVVAIAFNLTRGHAVDCGCFEVRSAGKSREELLRDMGWVLARDLGLLLLAAISLASSFREPRRRWPFRGSSRAPEAALRAPHPG